MIAKVLVEINNINVDKTFDYIVPYEYIEKTISFLESTVECEVIALCLFPVVQTFDWAGPVGPSNIISKESF